ncbi:hypothetical protein ACIPUP_11480 [Pectobacterium actinidiae]|uniref:HEPN domain-containing protein n=1 Tax=Pectobacterium actinidiae TaxID=1507808 RepID=A0ABW8GB68_9GAMM
MMNIITEDFVYKIDDKLIAADVKLHARPFCVVIEWMKEKNISGDILDKDIWDPVMMIYKSLYPKGDFSIPSLMVGGVALRDAMYPVYINVGYGSFSIDPLKCIDISQSELEFIFKHYPEQGWRAFYGVCDLWDFGYGIDDLINMGSPARELLRNAQSSAVATPRILSGTDPDAAVQTACLMAELSIKASLTHLGWTSNQLKKLSHHLPKLAAELIKIRPARNDEQLIQACSNFPNYVESRYSSHGMTRLELMELSMRALFVASEAIRRISQRNMANEIEERPDCPSRPAL